MSTGFSKYNARLGDLGVDMLLKDERGMYYIWVGLIMLPIALLVFFMLVDVERIELVRAQEVTLADAASLAAADTATPVSAYSYQYTYDLNGNITGIQGMVTSTSAVIQDPVAAESAARQTALKNMGVLANQENAGMMSVSISPTPGTDDDLHFQVIGTDSCVVKLTSTLRTFAAGALEKLYGLPANGKDEGDTSYGQAVITAN